MKTCSRCRSSMKAGVTDLAFNRSGLQIRFKNAPAFICENCGHKTTPGNIALYIDQIAQTIFTSEQPIRISEVVLEAA